MQTSVALGLGGLLLAAGAAAWVVLELFFHEFGRNVGEAIVILLVGVLTPMVGIVLLAAGLFLRIRSRRP